MTKLSHPENRTINSETIDRLKSRLASDTRRLMRLYVNAPIMSSIRTWTSADHVYHMAALITQDDSAGATFSVRADDGATQLSANYGSMLSLSFMLDHLNPQAKADWHTGLNGSLGIPGSDPQLLWQPFDGLPHEAYLVCLPFKPFVYIHAFAPGRHEAVLRIANPTMENLLDWLADCWALNPSF